jgi:hypothetical protein
LENSKRNSQQSETKDMKSSKLAFATIATVLALWAPSAKAAPELPLLFKKLNFSLVALLQDLCNSGPYGSIVLPNIETSKISSKDLLEYLATALNTNWPAGAQLALGEIEVPSGQAYGPPNIIWDIFVVDKTGTNPVFDVSTGINVGDTNIVFFGFDSDATVFSSKNTNVRLAKINESFGPVFINSGTGTGFGKIFFHLFNEQNGITNTDLYFDGLNEIKSHSEMVATTNNNTVHLTMSEQAPVTGDGTFDLEWTVIKGKVTSSKKWELHGIIAGPPMPLTNRPPTIIITNRIPTFTNWPPPIINTNRIIINTNRPPSGFHPTTNPPPPIILLNP